MAGSDRGSDSDSESERTAPPEGEGLPNVVKSYKHVPARLDPDFYQCPVPEGLLQQTPEEAAGNGS